MASIKEKINEMILKGGVFIKYGDKIIRVIIIYIAMKICTRIGYALINRFFERQKQSKFGLDERKSDTLSELLKSIIKYAIYIIGIISILKEVGFDISTLLVGAGFGGIAVGLGAQSIIKDVLSGFLILFEDQFSVGEYVTIEGMSGVVEALGLRITKLKDFSGDLHIIPNGQITKVTNHSRDNSRALVDVEIGYEEDIDNALQILTKISKEVEEENESIVEGPTVLGVSELGDKGVKITIVAKTKPLQQYGVERQLRKKIKENFDKENINIPYPTCVIVTKSGNN